MKKTLVSGLLFIGLQLAAAGAYAAEGGACKFSDADKLKAHLETHVKYPIKGEDLKAACVKEMPDEFTKAERACVGKKLKDNLEYKSAAEVYKALGVQQ